MSSSQNFVAGNAFLQADPPTAVRLSHTLN